MLNTKIMALFLRFTYNPDLDIERGASFHATDYREADITKKELAEILGCNTGDIESVNGMLVYMLNGLCGYELDAETIEEAIEEIEEGDWQFSGIGDPVIFKGVASSDSVEVPDGDLFHPQAILKILGNT